MQSPCVLVVDDDRDVRETVAECLEAVGYEVAQASNGREAFDALDVPPGLLLRKARA